jgi:hypothetical protein
MCRPGRSCSCGPGSSAPFAEEPFDELRTSAESDSDRDAIRCDEPEFRKIVSDQDRSIERHHNLYVCDPRSCGRTN